MGAYYVMLHHDCEVQTRLLTIACQYTKIIQELPANRGIDKILQPYSGYVGIDTYIHIQLILSY